mmetsp:Transcript_21918/g.29321  ORF Transcript_21918/g.29321 Transcript_21918/m.29321 type:complete len:80 (+) Transcript_21918:220-459(+)
MGTNINSFASTSIKTKCAISLQHLAYVRHAIFETAEFRQGFLRNFMTEMIKLLQSAALEGSILKDRELYKEFVPILTKL